MTLKINFNLNLPDSCCTLVPKNGVWTVPKIAACQIAKNAALLIPDYTHSHPSKLGRGYVILLKTENSSNSVIIRGSKF